MSTMSTDLDRILRGLEGHIPDPDQAYVSRVINVNGVLKTVQIPVPKSSAASIPGATRLTPSIPVAPVRPNITIPVANVRPSVQAVPRITSAVSNTTSTATHTPALLQLSNGMTISLPHGLQQQNQMGAMPKVILQPQQNVSGGLNGFNLVQQPGGGFTLVPNSSVAQNRTTPSVQVSPQATLPSGQLQFQSTPQGTFQIVPTNRTLHGNINTGLSHTSGPSQYPRLVLLPQAAGTGSSAQGNTTNIVFNMNTPQPASVAPGAQLLVNTGQSSQQPGLVMINPQNQQTTVVQNNMLVLQQGAKTSATQSVSTSSSVTSSATSVAINTVMSTSNTLRVPTQAATSTVLSTQQSNSSSLQNLTRVNNTSNMPVSSCQSEVRTSEITVAKRTNGNGMTSLRIVSNQSLVNSSTTAATMTSVASSVTARSSAPVIPFTAYLTGPNPNSVKDMPVKTTSSDPWLDSFVQFAQLTAPVPHEKPVSTDTSSAAPVKVPIKPIDTRGKLPLSVKLKSKPILPKPVSEMKQNSSQVKEQRRPGKLLGMIRDFGDIPSESVSLQKQGKKSRKRCRRISSSDDSDEDFEVKNVSKKSSLNADRNLELRHRKVNYRIESDSDDDIPIQWKGGKRRRIDYSARFRNRKPLKKGPPEVLRKLTQNSKLVLSPETKNKYKLKDCTVVLDYFDMKGRVSATSVYVTRTLNAIANAKAVTRRSDRSVTVYGEEDSQFSSTSSVSRSEKPFTLSFGLAPFLPQQLCVSGGKDSPLTINSVSSVSNTENRVEYDEETDIEEETVILTVGNKPSQMEITQSKTDQEAMQMGNTQNNTEKETTHLDNTQSNKENKLTQMDNTKNFKETEATEMENRQSNTVNEVTPMDITQNKETEAMQMDNTQIISENDVTQIDNTQNNTDSATAGLGDRIMDKQLPEMAVIVEPEDGTITGVDSPDTAQITNVIGPMPTAVPKEVPKEKESCSTTAVVLDQSPNSSNTGLEINTTIQSDGTSNKDKEKQISDMGIIFKPLEISPVPGQRHAEKTEKTAVIKPLNSVDISHVEDKAEETVENISEIDNSQEQCINESLPVRELGHSVVVGQANESTVPTVIQPVDSPNIGQTETIPSKTAVIAPMPKDTVL